MNQPIPSIGVVVLAVDKVLLVRHEEKAKHFTGVYGLASGVIEPGESAVEAAKRELKEETGLETNLEDLVELPTKYAAEIEGKTGTRKFDWTVFLCKKWTGQLSGEPGKTTPEWISVEELANLRLLPNIKEAVEEAKRF